MPALSELVPANFSAVVRLMKPKPYESSIIPTTTPPAPVHREGFTTSQLIVIGHSSSSREAAFYALDRRKSEQNCSLHSAIAKLLTPLRNLGAPARPFPQLDEERARHPEARVLHLGRAPRRIARVSKDGHKRDRASGHPSRRRFAPPQDEVCGFRPIRLVSWNRSTIREMPPVFGA